MKVIIAEKKIAAEAMAKALEIPIKTASNGYFEKEKTYVTWAMGNLTKACDADYYNEKYKFWKMEDLPILPDLIATQIDKTKKKQFMVINDLLKKAKTVINAGDCGQEGEFIIKLILEHARYKGEVKRLWYKSLKEKELKRAFSDLKESDDYKHLEECARLRQYVDWTFGINMTRAFTLKLSKKGEEAIRTGRVVTPTLNAIVKRYLEHQNYKVREYEVLAFEAFGLKFSSEELENPKKALSESKQFKISQVSEKKIEKKPDRLFSLNTLQQEANRIYGLTSEKTLSIAQDLYEKGLITYPRTESEALDEDFDVEELMEILKDHQSRAKIDKKDKRIFNSKEVEDHHALIITETKPTFDGDLEENIYKLIEKRTIAAFYEPCEKTKYEIEGEFVESGIDCKAEKTVIVKNGYKDIYNLKGDDEEQEEKEDKKISLPNKDEEISVEPILEQRKTKKPPLFTERSLIQFMMNAGKMIDQKLKNGIGTVATRSEIIAKLNRGGFFEYQKKKIVPTAKGIEVIEKIPVEEIKNPHLTVKLEGYFDQVKKGETIETLKKTYKDLFRMQFEKVKEIEGIDRSNRTDIDCPICQNKLLSGKKALFCEQRDKNDSSHFFIPLKYGDKTFSEAEIKALTEKKEVVLIQENESLQSVLVLDENYKLKKVTKGTCPKCKQESLEVGPFGIYCKQKCGETYGFSIPKTVKGATLSLKDMIKLLKGEKTGIYSFKGKKSYKAKLWMNEEFQLKFDFVKGGKTA